MNRTIAVVAAVAILMALAVTQTCAAVQDVYMADFLLLRIRCPAGGFTAQQRADAVEMRVNNLLRLGGFDLSTIEVRKSGDDMVLYANGQLLVTVDPCTALANNTTPEQLAEVWAQRLRTIYPQVVPKKPLMKRPSG